MTEPKPNILVIDDDENILASLRRQLVGRFNVVTAPSGQRAIDEVKAAQTRRTPFAVVVCDMRMPEMDGIQTLRHIGEIAPESVALMLTGNADQTTAMDAINSGHVFKFFTKPCAKNILEDGINDAVRKHRTDLAEQELLEKTLAGSIKVLIDLIATNTPTISNQARRIREFTRRLTEQEVIPPRWQLDIAASLALIGQLSLPVELLQRHHQGHPLSDEEREKLCQTPLTARELIANIPRLGKVAETIYLQDRGYDGSGFPTDGPVGTEIPKDARILKILKDLAEVTEQFGAPDDRAFAALEARAGQYDSKLFLAVKNCLEVPRAEPPKPEADGPLQKPPPIPASLGLEGKPARKTSGRAPPPRRLGNRTRRVIISVISVLLLAITATWVAYSTNRPKPELSDTKYVGLIKQIDAATKGEISRENIFGGRIAITEGGIEVDGVPRNACIQAAWRLVKKGILSINGTISQHITGATIAKQCQSQDNNVITLMPYPPGREGGEE